MGRYLHFVVLAAGAALLMLGVGVDGDVTVTDLPVLLGVVGLLIGLDLWLCRRHAPPVVALDEDARYELGYRDGHRVGYDKGRHARPVVVPFPVERLCRDNVAPRGRHAARCRDNCTADDLEAVGRVGSQEWDGAS